MRQSPTHRHRTEAPQLLMFIIYLLHCEFGNGTCSHYVGSTLEREFRRRMRSHAGGYGTTRTGAIYEAHAEIYLAKKWHRPSRFAERVLQRHPDVAKFCPICSPPLPLPGTVVPPTFRLAGAPPPQLASLSLAQ